MADTKEFWRLHGAITTCARENPAQLKEVLFFVDERNQTFCYSLRVAEPAEAGWINIKVSDIDPLEAAKGVTK